MTEKIREAAFELSSHLEAVSRWTTPHLDAVWSDEAAFLEMCKVFHANHEEFKDVAFLLRNGWDYVKQCRGDAIKKYLLATQNIHLPESIKRALADDLNQ